MTMGSPKIPHLLNAGCHACRSAWKSLIRRSALDAQAASRRRPSSSERAKIGLSVCHLTAAPASIFMIGEDDRGSPHALHAYVRNAQMPIPQLWNSSAGAWPLRLDSPPGVRTASANMRVRDRLTDALIRPSVQNCFSQSSGMPIRNAVVRPSADPAQSTITNGASAVLQHHGIGPRHYGSRARNTGSTAVPIVASNKSGSRKITIFPFPILIVLERHRPTSCRLAVHAMPKNGNTTVPPGRPRPPLPPSNDISAQSHNHAPFRRIARGQWSAA
jgi:hypothetical protein